MKSKLKNNQGFTLIELMMVVAIFSILISIFMPRADILLQRAHQSKTKSNLGAIRSALSIYYSDLEGVWPLAGYPEGDSHYTSDGLSLSGILIPHYIGTIETPKVYDRVGSFNGLSQSFDDASESLMNMNPPKDVYIIWGAAAYTPMLSSPFAYDNQNGTFYIPNGNYDESGNYIYTW